MAEYIDREAAIEFIRLNYCKDCNSYNGVRCRACSFDDAMLALEDVPVADVVEVVRCKACKHWRYCCIDPIINYDYGNCHCHQWENAESAPVTISNDFCSYGERKGGESDA